METAPIKINGKEFTAREFLLDDYPACMDAFAAMRDKEKLADAFRAVLTKCSDVPEADAKACTWREMQTASKIILQVNGMGPSPKAEAEAASPADTTSEAQSGPSAL